MAILVNDQFSIFSRLFHSTCTTTSSSSSRCRCRKRTFIKLDQKTILLLNCVILLSMVYGIFGYGLPDASSSVSVNYYQPGAGTTIGGGGQPSLVSYSYTISHPNRHYNLHYDIPTVQRPLNPHLLFPFYSTNTPISSTVVTSDSDEELTSIEEIYHSPQPQPIVSARPLLSDFGPQVQQLVDTISEFPPSTTFRPIDPNLIDVGDPNIFGQHLTSSAGPSPQNSMEILDPALLHHQQQQFINPNLLSHLNSQQQQQQQHHQQQQLHQQLPQHQRQLQHTSRLNSMENSRERGYDLIVGVGGDRSGSPINPVFSSLEEQRTNGDLGQLGPLIMPNKKPPSSTTTSTKRPYTGLQQQQQENQNRGREGESDDHRSGGEHGGGTKTTRNYQPQPIRTTTKKSQHNQNHHVQNHHNDPSTTTQSPNLPVLSSSTKGPVSVRPFSLSGVQPTVAQFEYKEVENNSPRTEAYGTTPAAPQDHPTEKPFFKKDHRDHEDKPFFKETQNSLNSASSDESIDYQNKERNSKPHHNSPQSQSSARNHKKDKYSANSRNSPLFKMLTKALVNTMERISQVSDNSQSDESRQPFRGGSPAALQNKTTTLDSEENSEEIPDSINFPIQIDVRLPINKKKGSKSSSTKSRSSSNSKSRSKSSKKISSTTPSPSPTLISAEQQNVPSKYIPSSPSYYYNKKPLSESPASKVSSTSNHNHQVEYSEESTSTESPENPNLPHISETTTEKHYHLSYPTTSRSSKSNQPSDGTITFIHTDSSEDKGGDSLKASVDVRLSTSNIKTNKKPRNKLTNGNSISSSTASSNIHDTNVTSGGTHNPILLSVKVHLNSQGQGKSVQQPQHLVQDRKSRNKNEVAVFEDDEDLSDFPPLMQISNDYDDTPAPVPSPTQKPSKSIPLTTSKKPKSKSTSKPKSEPRVSVDPVPIAVLDEDDFVEVPATTKRPKKPKTTTTPPATTQKPPSSRRTTIIPIEKTKKTTIPFSPTEKIRTQVYQIEDNSDLPPLPIGAFLDEDDEENDGEEDEEESEENNPEAEKLTGSKTPSDDYAPEISTLTTTMEPITTTTMTITTTARPVTVTMTTTTATTTTATPRLLTSTKLIPPTSNAPIVMSTTTKKSKKSKKKSSKKTPKPPVAIPPPLSPSIETLLDKPISDDTGDENQSYSSAQDLAPIPSSSIKSQNHDDEHDLDETPSVDTNDDQSDGIDEFPDGPEEEIEKIPPASSLVQVQDIPSSTSETSVAEIFTQPPITSTTIATTTHLPTSTASPVLEKMAMKMLLAGGQTPLIPITISNITLVQKEVIDQENSDLPPLPTIDDYDDNEDSGDDSGESESDHDLNDEDKEVIQETQKQQQQDNMDIQPQIQIEEKPTPQSQIATTVDSDILKTPRPSPTYLTPLPDDFSPSLPSLGQIPVDSSPPIIASDLTQIYEDSDDSDLPPVPSIFDGDSFDGDEVLIQNGDQDQEEELLKPIVAPVISTTTTTTTATPTTTTTTTTTTIKPPKTTVTTTTRPTTKSTTTQPSTTTTREAPTITTSRVVTDLTFTTKPQVTTITTTRPRQIQTTRQTTRRPLPSQAPIPEREIVPKPNHQRVKTKPSLVTLPPVVVQEEDDQSLNEENDKNFMIILPPPPTPPPRPKQTKLKQTKPSVAQTHQISYGMDSLETKVDQFINTFLSEAKQMGARIQQFFNIHVGSINFNYGLGHSPQAMIAAAPIEYTKSKDDDSSQYQNQDQELEQQLAYTTERNRRPLPFPVPIPQDKIKPTNFPEPPTPLAPIDPDEVLSSDPDLDSFPPIPGGPDTFPQSPSQQVATVPTTTSQLVGSQAPFDVPGQQQQQQQHVDDFPEAPAPVPPEEPDIDIFGDSDFAPFPSSDQFQDKTNRKKMQASSISNDLPPLPSHALSNGDPVGGENPDGVFSIGELEDNNDRDGQQLDGLPLPFLPHESAESRVNKKPSNRMRMMMKLMSGSSSIVKAGDVLNTAERDIPLYLKVNDDADDVDHRGHVLLDPLDFRSINNPTNNPTNATTNRKSKSRKEKG